jgi:hypothetical protein
MDMTPEKGDVMRAQWIIEADADEEALREHVAKHGEPRYLIVADPSEFAEGDLEAAVGEEIVENVEVADFEVIAETDA